MKETFKTEEELMDLVNEFILTKQIIRVEKDEDKFILRIITYDEETNQFRIYIIKFDTGEFIGAEYIPDSEA